MKKPKLKKHFYTAIIPIILIAGVGTHLIAMLLYTLAHLKEIQTINIQVFFSKEIYDFILADPNGKIILQVALALFFVGGAYLVRESVFQKTYRDESEFGVHGSAKLEDATELMNGKFLSKKAKYSKMPFVGYKKVLNMEEGIVLGKIGKKVIVIPEDSSLSNKNIFVIGPPGSGKGQTNVITNLVNIRNQSIINIDVKGENWYLTHQIKVDQGYKVGRLDFVDFQGWGFNPMAFVQTDEDAQKLADITAKNGLADGKEDFFQERARTLLKLLIVYVKRHFSQENANFDSLITIYDKYIASEKIYMEWIESQDEDDEGVQGLKSFFSSLTGKTRSSVTSSFDSIISVYRLDKVREMTKKSDFDFEDFVNDKYALYIKIAVPSNPYTSLTSAFFTQMIDAFFTIARKSPISELPTPVNLLLDEFANIGKIAGYSNTLALCRGYLIYITTIVQDLSQLEKVYGKDDSKSIIATHDTKLILSIGEKDTAKYFSEYFGEATVSYPETTGTGSNVQTRMVTVKKPLVTVNDLMTMDRNMAYVQFTGHNVCKVEKSWQFEIFGDMITKNKKYNYDKFRKRLLNVEEHPLYEEKVEYRETKSFSDIYNEKQNFIEEKLREQEIDQEAIEYQKEIREPIVTEDVEETEGNKEHQELLEAKKKTSLKLMGAVGQFLEKSSDIENKEALLSQLGERIKQLNSEETEENDKISNLGKIKDVGMKNIARLQAKLQANDIDPENDKNDNLLGDYMQEEMSIQGKIVEMVENDTGIVGKIIQGYMQTQSQTSNVIDTNVHQSVVVEETIKETEELSLEDMVENHLAKEKSSDPFADFDEKKEEDSTDPFAGFDEETEQDADNEEQSEADSKEDSADPFAKLNF
ncbi:VirD4-like conjugal transfer protein, CD1115 family [Bacillus pseudomycoides]|uniref:VirD4-like conjugal transfer protein, CD1115 family n=1 Tax=Bacillus pseudomycoides TaxID=64104 RepID=UPI000BF91C54|nr:type IV secretory system conjugative DNA transfer family protein [Bacillus pseudomycoides]PGA62234.1 hypothetical protein COL84_13770 [Bacillus pseudomycoides]